MLIEEMDRPTYRELIEAPWMSGILAVTNSNSNVLLIKRHYPVAVCIWSLLLFGGLDFFVVERAIARYSTLFIVMSVFFVFVFAAVAVRMDRKSPILVARRAGTLTLPRYKRTFNLGELQSICFQPVVYDRVDDSVHGGCLLARLSKDSDPTPLYLDDCRGQVRKVAIKLAAVLGVPFEPLEKQDMR
jgi:hypothetical protein